MRPTQCEHADALSYRADVRRWMRRLERVAADMPDGVRVFIASGSITVMDECDEGTHGGAVERNRHIVGTVPGGGWDGGDT